MNKIILIGRLVKDPEIKLTASQVAVCKFTIAVDRKFKNKDGEREADFISCVAWRQQAEFIGKYFQKGSRICITGALQTGTYKDKDDKTIYTADVVIEEAEFVDTKKDLTSQNENTGSGIPSSSGKKINDYLPPEIDNGFYPAMDDVLN